MADMAAYHLREDRKSRVVATSDDDDCSYDEADDGENYDDDVPNKPRGKMNDEERLRRW